MAPAYHIRRADGTSLPVGNGLMIGRDLGADVCIDHDLVSRQHARLAGDASGIYLEDLESRNGTRVNGKRIQGRIPLKPGDSITIGSETLTLCSGPANTAKETVLSGPQGTVLGAPGSGWYLTSEQGKSLEVNLPLTVGRDPSSDFPLPDDRLVSMQHARIEIRGADLYVVDLKSSNGTRVNGRTVQGSSILRSGDRVSIGGETFRVRRASDATSGPGSGRRAAMLGVGLLIAVIGCVGIYLVVNRPWGKAKLAASTEPAKAALSRDQLERNVMKTLVHIVSPGGGSGSGSIITKDGLVLTNFHVVAAYNSNQDIVGVYKTAEVQLNRENPGERPDESFQAAIVKYSQTFDLALLRIDGGTGSAEAVSFPAITLGGADSLQLGQEVTVLGYPGIGGDFPTLTRGTMSGFMPDELNGIDHGWIKTDAEINYGNSGGIAIDGSGALIGVPTQIRPSFMPVATPITAGKLGLLRPINVVRIFLQGYLPEP